MVEYHLIKENPFSDEGKQYSFFDLQRAGDW